MSNKKQSISDVSSVDFIYNAFNLLSDADFKAWMLNTHDFIKAMHKEEIEVAQSIAISKADMTNNRGYFDAEKYYNETFGGSHE